MQKPIINLSFEDAEYILAVLNLRYENFKHIHLGQRTLESLKMEEEIRSRLCHLIEMAELEIENAKTDKV